MVAHYVSDLRLCAGGMGGRNDDLLFRQPCPDSGNRDTGDVGRDIACRFQNNWPHCIPTRANSSVCGTVFATVRRGISDFGLERNAHLLSAAFPCYARAANRLVRDVAAAYLQQQLNAFIALPPNSPQRTATGEQRYKQLKALLMMSRRKNRRRLFQHHADGRASTLCSCTGRYPAKRAAIAADLPGWLICRSITVEKSPAAATDQRGTQNSAAPDWGAQCGEKHSLSERPETGLP